MPARLERFLAAVEPALGATVTSYRPISGGYSRVTAVAEHPDRRRRASSKLVLRSDPPADKGVFTSDRDREWPLLQAMWDIDTVEIPRPRWYDGTGELMGTQDASSWTTSRGPRCRRRSAPDADLAAARTVFLDVAAALLRTPLDAAARRHRATRPTGTATSTAPSTSTSRAERELVDSSPIIRYVSAWLRANKPPPVPLGLVHGDFQPGNILVADGRPPVVIDWEFTRIGDPREDIGYYSGSPLPEQPLRRRSRGVPRRVPRAHRLHRGAGQPAGDGVLLHPRHGRAVRADDAGADALSRGQPKGIMAPFLVNSLCYFHEKYLEICTR